MGGCPTTMRMTRALIAILLTSTLTFRQCIAIQGNASRDDNGAETLSLTVLAINHVYIITLARIPCTQ